MAENNRRRDFEADVARIADRVEAAVDRGVDAAERIHRRLVAIPLDIVAPEGNVEAAVNDLRRVQSRTLDVVYGVAHDINHEVAGLARAWMGGDSEPPKATRKRVITKNSKDTKKTPTAKGKAPVRAA